MPEQQAAEVELRCVERGETSPPDAKGWQSHLGYDSREDEGLEALMFCPECAEREFG